MLVEDITLTATTLFNKTAQASSCPVSTTHNSAWLTARLCTANGIICARSLTQFISTRSAQRSDTSSIFDDLSFSHTSLTIEDYIPTCHLYLSYLEHMYVCWYACRYWSLEMLPTLYSGVSSLLVRESYKIHLDVQRDCDVCTGPIFLPLSTFLLAITASTRS